MSRMLSPAPRSPSLSAHRAATPPTAPPPARHGHTRSNSRTLPIFTLSPVSAPGAAIAPATTAHPTIDVNAIATAPAAACPPHIARSPAAALTGATITPTFAAAGLETGHEHTSRAPTAEVAATTPAPAPAFAPEAKAEVESDMELLNHAPSPSSPALSGMARLRQKPQQATIPEEQDHPPTTNDGGLSPRRASSSVAAGPDSAGRNGSQKRLQDYSSPQSNGEPHAQQQQPGEQPRAEEPRPPNQQTQGNQHNAQSQSQSQSLSSSNSGSHQGQSSAAASTPLSSAASGAAATATTQHQPKVVQTAFIHKLYSMLQDPSIQHLITWSSSNESFLMNPSSEFSKVLSQYFKHTNISSFVRQLNMYGFHKVSDVFHTGTPDSTMWEFKHGNGNFKKGDVAGLREIKRRASRHTLIHRDSFSTGGHKLSSNTNHHQNNGPHGAEPQEGGADAARFLSLEHSVFDMHSRLSRMEESHALVSSKCQVLTESLIRCHQWASSMSYFITALVPESNPMRQEIVNMQREISRQLDIVRSVDSPPDPLNGRIAPQPPHYGAMPMDPMQQSALPLSPRQVAHDDGSHRSNLRPPSQIPHSMGSQLNYPHPRYYATPSHTRPSQQHSPHPLSHVMPPHVTPSVSSTGRRHTSADIREFGWGPPHQQQHQHQPAQSQQQHQQQHPHQGTSQPTHNGAASHFQNANSSAMPGQPTPPSYSHFQWPASSSSPHRDPNMSQPPPPPLQPLPGNAEQQQVRDLLDRYEMGGSSRPAQDASSNGPRRQASPPPSPLPPHAAHGPHNASAMASPLADGVSSHHPGPAGGSGMNLMHAEPTWTMSRFAHPLPSSVPATRRSSMASNVHSLLNPAADAGERLDDDSEVMEDRKRKRLV